MYGKSVAVAFQHKALDSSTEYMYCCSLFKYFDQHTTEYKHCEKKLSNALDQKSLAQVPNSTKTLFIHHICSSWFKDMFRTCW